MTECQRACAVHPSALRAAPRAPRARARWAGSLARSTSASCCSSSHRTVGGLFLLLLVLLPHATRSLRLSRQLAIFHRS